MACPRISQVRMAIGSSNELECSETLKRKHSEAKHNNFGNRNGESVDCTSVPRLPRTDKWEKTSHGDRIALAHDERDRLTLEMFDTEVLTEHAFTMILCSETPERGGYSMRKANEPGPNRKERKGQGGKRGKVLTTTAARCSLALVVGSVHSLLPMASLGTQQGVWGNQSDVRIDVVGAGHLLDEVEDALVACGVKTVSESNGTCAEYLKAKATERVHGLRNIFAKRM
ncbi:LOW QUALITY PROTEIN: hypothetical protein MARPO_0168s0013 [Marchantia polymorpha]|uniref:Uncharacterized protein n=1 Tax=Marchantia polymorpha TaxID=3197 RepID=A0A2R6W348_MARPO|nr:LOW QUALITY PROTEIN: hypothetical protein MARPO_0168s0013 [Marchantia polymorpha]|eukprot:PTQ28289.1 LOW QUALITY PROTEIN: hypothetical protein MARPO_0168s0013 [Marchantia polymorpha]